MGYPEVMSRPLRKPRPPFGQHLADLRKAAGFSQQALADAIGESQASVSHWEVGDHTPRAEVLPKLATALGCTIEELLDVNRASAARKRGPTGKAQRLFEEVARLPKRQQDRVLEMVNIFLEQERRRTG